MHYRGPIRDPIWRNNSWNIPWHRKGHCQTNPGSTEYPSSINPRRNTERHTVIKLTQMKANILKVTRDKWQITYKITPISISYGYQLIISWFLQGISLFLNRSSTSQKIKTCYISSDERGESLNKNILSSRTLIQIWGSNEKLYRSSKAKRIQHHQTSFTTNVKGNYLGSKHKRRERSTWNDLQTIKKMVKEHTYW